MISRQSLQIPEQLSNRLTLTLADLTQMSAAHPPTAAACVREYPRDTNPRAETVTFILSLRFIFDTLR